MQASPEWLSFHTHRRARTMNITCTKSYRAEGFFSLASLSLGFFSTDWNSMLVRAGITYVHAESIAPGEKK